MDSGFDLCPSFRIEPLARPGATLGMGLAETMGMSVATRSTDSSMAKKHNPSGIAVELRDLKPLLGEVVSGDALEASLEPAAAQAGQNSGWQVRIERYYSGYLDRKLKEQVAKKKLQPTAVAMHSNWPSCLPAYRPMGWSASNG